MDNVLAKKENANTMGLTSAKGDCAGDEVTVFKLADAFERLSGGFAMPDRESRHAGSPASRSAQRPNPAMPTRSR
jgi:hypothetical protein